jgi:uncharacterized protein YprB with RNaseH-like and TPR domain
MHNSAIVSRLRDLVGGAARETAIRVERAVNVAPRSLAHVTEALGGDIHEGQGGSCVVVDRWYTSETRHGDLTIGSCADITRRYMKDLSVLDAARRNGVDRVSDESAIHFFDLETTGLAGGAGTYAFLVGFGAFVGRSFFTRQLFLTGYGAEPPLLETVAKWITRAGVLVSFNGRTFDAPILETRYLFHRMAVPFAEIPHIDMLPASRRLWSREEGCALRVLEDAIAGVTRRGDVPGAEIPARYVHYARTGDARLLVPVFEHNRLDLLSLAVLTSIAVRMVGEGAEATRDAKECLGLGRLYERVGLDERATTCYARAASDQTQNSDGVRTEALRWLARRMRRESRHDDAAEAWQQILALGAAESPVMREAVHGLAVHHEHRSRDLRAAHRFALRAVAAAANETHRAQARQRLARLDRKLGVESKNVERALFER